MTTALEHRLPPDAVLVPYTGGNSAYYEHAFAAFAHELIGSARAGVAGKDLIQTTSTRYREKYIFILLKATLVAWNLDTNRTMVCRALILVDSNQSGRRDVWTSDNPDLGLNMFKSL